MAEGKNRIIVYKDWHSTFDKLTDEEAGKLIKHFFNYVNDTNPKAPDRITELLFEPIKNTLKRDLKAWEDKAVNNSNSGRLGNLKKYHIDLYKQVINKDISIEDAEKIAKGRKCENNIANAKKVSQNVAVSDSDSVSVIEEKNIIQEEILVSPKVETKQKKVIDFDFSFVNENFKEVFLDWLNYKKAKGQKYKTQQSLEMCYKNLLKISNNNPETARECIESSIANNYSGIFPLKNKPNERTRPTTDQIGAIVTAGKALADARKNE